MRVTTTSLPSGALRHAIGVTAQALPPVRPAALVAAWEAARASAEAGLWGPARLIAFEDGVEIALTDADAACWAEAMARRQGLDSLGDVALCLRLLALVEVLGRAKWLRGFFTITAEGAEFHPALLAAAARAPLDTTGRFEDGALRAMLARSIPYAPT
ncbi:hypothetical protein [Sediminicoccus sp. KRV36]|uniref:hypothetical protein n=1 Tax=Sediminicoccus sp. KRV36 TaxID=3133721 RepID=UPI00200EB3F4|nr:hypothetical protein [Sediminicoccus rosea]UPY38549.1 hypothetical protein LHU95_07600 [Sediminicoccus rosea]